MSLRVKRLDPRAVLPRRAHDGDAGLDLHALDGFELAPGERAQVRTGIAIALPPGTAGMVLPRSGLAARHGISVVNAPGLIDEGYRGELQVLLLNTDVTETFRAQAEASGLLARKRRALLARQLEEILRDRLMSQVRSRVLNLEETARIVDRMAARQLDPWSAADQVLGRMGL